MSATAVNETQLQEAVIDLAHTFGWSIAHFRPAMTKHGWRTPVSADGKGWPDLVLVSPLRASANHHRGGVLFRELKGKYDRLTPEQEAWGEWLSAAGADWDVWRPVDWPHIVETLSFGRSVA